MKYKKLFLVFFLLLLFVLQQAKVGAEGLIKIPVMSPLAFNPPASVSVTFYHLQPDGKLQLTRGKPTPCSLRKNNNVYDDTYGCTALEHGGYFWSYPYPANPYNNVPVETDYLLDVLSHEMDPHTYPNLQSEMAQAVASRTFAYNKNPLTNFGDPNGTNLKASQLDIPFAFEVWIANPYTYNYPNNSNYPCQSTNLAILQRDVCNAVTATQGYYLSQNGSPIDAEFGDDAIGQTIDGGTSYLKSVQDPISTTCGATNNGNRWGMSQEGANRWELGNQCSSGGSASTSWIVKWSDYRQILAHYYTGIDFLNGGGAYIAPDDRWNLLNFNNNTPLQMDAGATNNYNVVLQNTSTTTWNDIVLGYQWTPINGTAQSGNWQALGSLPSLQAGGSVGVVVPITAPTTPGIYTLHLDVRHSNSNNWFSDAGWPDAKISSSCVGAVCSQIIQGSDDAGTNPSGCIFSATDNEVYLGEGFNNCGNITSGFRFNNLAIPQAAHIQSAYIAFTVDGPYSDNISVLIDGELNTNAPTYSQSNPPTDPSRVLTGSPVPWSVTDTWGLGQLRFTSDISTVIQQIVNQASWTNGNNSLSIIIKNNGSTSTRRVIAFERAMSNPTLYSAQLVITYTP